MGWDVVALAVHLLDIDRLRGTEDEMAIRLTGLWIEHTRIDGGLQDIFAAGNNGSIGGIIQ